MSWSLADGSGFLRGEGLQTDPMCRYGRDIFQEHVLCTAPWGYQAKPWLSPSEEGKSSYGESRAPGEHSPWGKETVRCLGRTFRAETRGRNELHAWR